MMVVHMISPDGTRDQQYISNYATLYVKDVLIDSSRVCGNWFLRGVPIFCRLIRHFASRKIAPPWAAVTCPRRCISKSDQTLPPSLLITSRSQGGEHMINAPFTV